MRTDSRFKSFSSPSLMRELEAMEGRGERERAGDGGPPSTMNTFVESRKKFVVGEV